MLSNSTKSLLLFILVITTIVHANAQENIIKLPLDRMPAESIIDEIKAQTPYRFILRSDELELNRTIHLTSTTISVREALDAILAGTEKSYLLDGNYIVLPAHGIIENHATLDNPGKITGIVSNSTGDTRLIEVNVELSGSRFHTTTDQQGAFSITGIPAGRHYLRFHQSGKTKYVEVTVKPDTETRIEVRFSTYAYDAETQPGTIYSTRANPIRTPESYAAEARYIEPPLPGTYTFVPIDRRMRDYQPRAAIKTNFLYWATTTVNVGLELYLSPKWSLNLHTGFNPWEKLGYKHWLVQPEVRYWFCNTFEQHFIGLHGIYGKFNLRDAKIPFTDKLEDHVYKGYGIGAGIAYGYHLPISGRWGMEFSLGVGYVYLKYKKYKCEGCSNYLGKDRTHYFGPTKASVSLLFMIN